MVDEFQDTNRLQTELLDLLCEGSDADLFVVGDEFQSIYGFRHADVAVFRERRSAAPTVLPLTRNHRSRPEVLAAVNELFGGEFGDEFQRLEPADGADVPALRNAFELLVTDKAATAEAGVHWRRSEAQARRPARARARRRRGRDAGRDRAALRRRHRRRVVRGGAARRRPADVPRGRAQLLRAAAGRRPARLPAPPPQPLRRRGAPERARLAVRRRVERRARPDQGRGAAPAGVPRPRASAARQTSPEDDRRLLLAFRQRYERLLDVAAHAPLELLCERILAEHDYDLAILALPDGRRRYANLRKLARLARSYEELRGADLEGFVRFVEGQEAVGAKESDAVSEEEGSDAVRLLTIHAAKGLEFEVVVVADAGRSRPPVSDILALSDGRFGFKVAHPATGTRVSTTSYQDVKAHREHAEQAERLRLYYVAMTRAKERLIVSGLGRRRRRTRATRRRSAGC